MEVFDNVYCSNSDHIPDAESLLMENHISGLDHKDSTLFPFPFAVELKNGEIDIKQEKSQICPT
jgi:hypothetical protein